MPTRTRPLLGLACAVVAAMYGSPTALGAQCRSGLDTAVFRRVVRERFSALLGPASKGVPGSYAALDLKDAEVTFAGTTTVRSGAVLGAKASGAISNGILSAITNQDVNEKFGATLQVHFLHPGTNTLQYNAASCGAYQAAARKAEEAYSVRAVEIARDYATTLWRAEIAAIAKTLGEVREARSKAVSQYVADSLEVAEARLSEQLAQAFARPLSDVPWQRYASGSQRAEELQKARALLKVEGFAFGWWSFSYGVQTSGFRLFDPAAVRDSAVRKRVYPSHGGGVTYSHYTSSRGSGESRFWSVGANLAWEDNLGGLKKRQLRDRHEYSQNPDERISEQSYAVYEGDYERNLVTLRLTGDYYRFLFDQNQAAVHLFPAVTFKEHSRTAYAAGAGLLLTARKSEGESFVNAELFYNLTDLTDAVTNTPDTRPDERKKLLGRSVLGLRFTFPITFAPKG